MKLVKEYINEKFTDESDPIHDLGIGKRALIKKWFKSMGINSRRYTIDDKFNISLRGNLDLYLNQTVTELPDNLTVEGYVDLRRTNIIELPDNLTVGSFLDIEMTKIKKLPKSLRVKSTIYRNF